MDLLKRPHNCKYIFNMASVLVKDVGLPALHEKIYMKLVLIKIRGVLG